MASFWKNHKKVERNVTLLTVLSLCVVSVGGLVEIAPLFYLDSTIEEVDGMRPYTPLELAGRAIYIREGCYTCHSQMVRPMRDEDERYGHFSLAAESMFDHPFQWGSKRTGPDLARVGGRYTDDWHVQHLTDPREVVPESIMPAYAYLAERSLDAEHIALDLEANVAVGVPYTPEMVANASLDLLTQARPDSDLADIDGFQARYAYCKVLEDGTVQEGDDCRQALARPFDGDPGDITEMDALVAYLQVLGTLVDFSTYDPAEAANLR